MKGWFKQEWFPKILDQAWQQAGVPYSQVIKAQITIPDVIWDENIRLILT